MMALRQRLARSLGSIAMYCCATQRVLSTESLASEQVGPEENYPRIQKDSNFALQIVGS